MNITIDDSLKNLTPNLSIFALTADVEVLKSEVSSMELKEIEQSIINKYELQDVIKIPKILDGRNAYKKYGKDPSRYRLAVESLYRRLVKGNSLYQINALVDLGNLISLQTMRSVAVLDYNKLKGNIQIRLGQKGETIDGIGRGRINIENILVYADNEGIFGSTTSDTARTMITNETKKILLFVINFSSDDDYIFTQNVCEQLVKKYAEAKNINTFKINFS